jgi:hypothetical protein
MGPTSGLGVEVVTWRGGSSSPLPPRVPSPSSRQEVDEASRASSWVSSGDFTSPMPLRSVSVPPADGEVATVALAATTDPSVGRVGMRTGGISVVGGGLLHHHPLLQPMGTWRGSLRLLQRRWVWLGSWPPSLQPQPWMGCPCAQHRPWVLRGCLRSSLPGQDLPRYRLLRGLQR